MVKGWLGLALLALPSYCQPAIAQSGAHGDGHAQHHEEYQQWKQANGASCCSDADCRPVRSQPGALGWEALVEGQWLAIPPLAILKRSAKDGHAHLCEAHGTVYCFVPGGAGT